MFRVPPTIQALLRLPGVPTLTAPLVVAMAAGLAGCANGASPSNNSPVSLQGVWEVSALTGQSLAGQTMQIDADGGVSGFAGCNRYVSSIQRGAAGQVSFAPGAATKMACLDGGAMRSEAAFLAMLGEVRSVREQGAGLVLLDGEGRVLAELLATE